MSDDGRYLAYLQFDDSNVPMEQFPMFNDPTDIYGSVVQIPYPKVSQCCLKVQSTPIFNFSLYVAQYQYIMWAPVLELKAALYEIN